MQRRRMPARNRVLKRSTIAGAVIALSALVGACSAHSQVPPPPPPQPVAGPLAFPGAVGWGAGAKGGRGGKVIAVTTLADSGGGSLRACIDAEGPRTCVFRVAGLIRFTGLPPVIKNPYLTIAGQTAPGGGIMLAHSGAPDGRTPMVIKNTHDIVVRDIRVRLYRIGGQRESEDAFTIQHSSNVILDHVSGSWARDENVNPYGQNDNITISWSIFAEGIPKHDKCALLGSDPQGPQHLSFIGNLCAHNGDRNPDVNFEPGSCVEIVNNVFYDAQSQFAEIWQSYGGTPVSVVGNVMRRGPSTARQGVGLDVVPIAATGKARIYAWGNKYEGKFVHESPLLPSVRVSAPPCALTVAPLDAEAAYTKVLGEAGAFPRDAVDARIVNETETRTGHIVHQPGTLPVPAAGAPYPDRDGDGMDDRWERANGADPTRFDAWADANHDGLANLDAFLDYAHRQLIAHSKDR